MSAANRTAVIRQLADAVADPPDLANPLVNVVDKGMSPGLPAPDHTSPLVNDDRTWVADDPSAQLSVTDKGPSVPLKPAARRQPSAEASEQKLWAALDLADKKAALRQLDPRQRVAFAKWACQNMSFDAITGQVQAYASVLQTQQRQLPPARPVSRRAARAHPVTQEAPGMPRQAAQLPPGPPQQPRRRLRSVEAAQAANDDALTALALEA